MLRLFVESHPRTYLVILGNDESYPAHDTHVVISNIDQTNAVAENGHCR
jgi:hypothetical protein